MKYQRFIRVLPTVLLVAAATDFLKQSLLLASTWSSVRYFNALPSDDGVRLKVLWGLAEQAIGLILFPLGWITSAMMLVVLLSIYDRDIAIHA